MRIRVVCEGPSDEGGLKKLICSPALSFAESTLGIDVRNLKDVASVFRKIGPYVRNAISNGNADKVFSVVDLIGSTSYVSGPPTPENVRQVLRERVEPEYREAFHPHVAVHEIEAWVFADEGALGARLNSSVSSHGTPEEINHTRSPSGRLNELYRARLKRPYKKTVELPLLLEKADVRVLYNKCPNLKGFLDDLANAGGLASPFKLSV